MWVGHSEFSVVLVTSDNASSAVQPDCHDDSSFCQGVVAASL